MADELMGLAEVAELLGVTRQRVHQLAQRSDFPKPTARLSAGLIWLGADVRQWAVESGRLGESADSPQDGQS
ncbi:helix-turn-helix transcriptional regulator [Nocardioides bruguierae]|uniref:AlpA family phage regulatory protein n=1 Tax=Nocardioides bruguierae TaxID=2945102 RepID=A0A9X2IEM3_9ACTN|nr:AlpA family phage regulatory protein [Nocardioides bruguierae]MCM0618760.1 AlpA family phage regulatory protein [Nocardioides bruguierae]